MSWLPGVVEHVVIRECDFEGPFAVKPVQVTGKVEAVRLASDQFGSNRHQESPEKAAVEVALPK